MRICVLQAGSPPPNVADRCPGFGRMFMDLLAEPGQAWDVCPVEQGGFPADPLTYDRFVITGSRNSVDDDLDWIRTLMELIREVHRHERPVLAVCFGHQAVAHALGGAVIRNPLGWDVGLRRVSLTPEAAGFRALAGLPNPFRILKSHRDTVVRLPDGCTPLARSETTEHEAFLAGDSTLSLQGHPEFTDELVRAIVEDRRDRGVLSSERAAEALRSLTDPPDHAPLRALLREFIRTGRLG